MNIMFCGDKNIQDGLMIAILSLINQSKEKLNIYVLTLDVDMNGKHYEMIGDNLIDFLNGKVKEKDAESFVKKIDVTEHFKKEMPSANLGTRFTPCCMLRLFADEIEEIPDTVLYLDTDVIVKCDCSEFYYQDMDGIEIAGVLDYYGRWFFKKNPLKFDYLNSGVLLLNMKEIRKTGLFKKCRSRCTQKKMFMPDQSSLNKLAVNKKICPRRYNDQRRYHEDTVIQHFTTTFRFFPRVKTVTVKPWNIESVHNVLKLYQYDDVLDEFQNTKKEYLERL
ncbi:MAG: glycosyltransferase [Eubacteriales bacterium]|nr:glycosyltransferase [Eubacteriales bacterium]